MPYHVCGAQQDNSTACVPSTGGGELYDVGGGESGYIAPDPEDTDVFYAGSYGGLLTRINRRTGERRSINVWPDNPMGHSSSDMTERFQWTFPIVIAPTNPNVLYVTSQHVWRSTNEGQSWDKISGDLTRHDPATMGPSGGPITLDQTGVETYATVFTLAPSPIDGNVIWAGSDDGVVHVTRDGGKNWQKVTPERPAGLHAHQPDRRVAARGRHRLPRRQSLPARRPRARTSTRRPTTARPGRRSSPAFPATTSRARSAKTRSARACCSSAPSSGIFVSFDDGAQWQSLAADLPVTPVHGIEVKDNDLVIGTHGRSFYILDNISVLRQANATTTSEPLVLFDPADAVRSVSRGVMIDYYLKDAADKVTIDILDPAGKLIRTYSGPQQQPAATPGRPAEMEEGEGGAAPGAGRARHRDRGHEPLHVGHALSERASIFPG